MSKNTVGIEKTEGVNQIVNVNHNIGKVKTGLGKGRKGRRQTKKPVATVCVTDAMGVHFVCTKMSKGPGVEPHTFDPSSRGGRGMRALWSKIGQVQSEMLPQKTMMTMRSDDSRSGPAFRVCQGVLALKCKVQSEN